jgi:hypothetical protein
MWPFQGLSLSAATAWSDAASLVLIACFLAGAVATFVLIQTTNVKEQYWRAATAETPASPKVAEQQPAKAAPAVQAAPAAADTSDRSASTPPLTPQPPPIPPKTNGPRTLAEDQIQFLVQKVSEFKHHHVTVGASPVTSESGPFADQLVLALKTAGVSAARNDSSAQIQVGSPQGVVARYVTGNDRGEQFAKSLADALTANGIAATATGGLVEEIMENITKQGRPINDPANEWVVVAVGDKAQ